MLFRSFSAINCHGNIPLHLAALGGYTSLVELLLERGVPINARNSFGETAFYYASQKGHDGIAELLLRKGASL